MLTSYLSDFSLIKERLDRPDDPGLFGKSFSFFLAEPVMFYQLEKNKIVYVNELFLKEFDYELEDIAYWNYSIYPLIETKSKEKFSSFLHSIDWQQGLVSTNTSMHLIKGNGIDKYYKMILQKLQKDIYLIRFQESSLQHEVLVHYISPETEEEFSELSEKEKMLEIKIFELQRSNEELEEFAYIASHDLQEPLRKIATFGKRLKQEYESKLGMDGNLFLSRMLLAAENMRNLIDSLLEFSKISKDNKHHESVNIMQMIQDAMEDLQIQIIETAAQISIGPMPTISGINSQLRQLFFNLLHNAMKFRRKDIQLQVEIQSKKMETKEKKYYHLSTSIEHYLITVKDNGIGFKQEYAEKIFHLFQRLEGKSEFPGSGIGLSICRKIVTNHKGLIFVNGEPGEGTVFSIILPKEQ